MFYTKAPLNKILEEKNGTDFKRVLLYGVIAVAIALAVLLCVFNVALPVSDRVAKADDPVAISKNATSGLSSFTTSYNNKTITMSIGTPASGNVSWSAYSKHGQTYSLNLASGKFGVKKGGNYGSFNSYAAVLNIAVPQWLQDLAASTTLSVTISGDYYCWRHRTMQDDAEFYFGITQSTSILNQPINLTNSTVRDNLNEDSGTSFLPGYLAIKNQKIGTGTTATSETGNYSGSFTLSSSSKYIGIGISGHADAYPGYATPESYLQNIKISFSYDGGTVSASNSNIILKNNNYGSCKYTFYSNATVKSPGTPETEQTLAKNGQQTLSSSNPFAFVVVKPQESVDGYRFKEISVNGTTLDLNYDTSKDDAPNSFLLSTLTNSTLVTKRNSAYSGSYYYQDGDKESTINFTARTFKIVYKANGGTGSDRTNTYTYDKAFTLPEVTSYFSKNGALESGWLYDSDNMSVTPNPNNRKTVYPSSTELVNPVKNLNINTLTIIFQANWVDAVATSTELSFSNSSYSKLYSDVTYTISTTKTGHTLANVYAEYTSGDLDGQKIALERIGTTNKWILYGISGNCTLTGEWCANTYSITYSVNSTYGTISSSTPNSYIYGYGVSVYSLPYVTAKTGYVWKGWSDTSTGSPKYTDSFLFTNTAEDKTIYAIFTAKNTFTQKITSTSNVSTATDLTSGLTASSYVKHGKTNISNTAHTFSLVGKTNGVSNSITVLSASQLGWAYEDVDIATNDKSYAHYYIYLDQDAVKNLRAGYSVKVTITATYKVGAFIGRDASDDASARVGIGVISGINDSSTGIYAWGDTVNGKPGQGSTGFFGAGAKDSNWVTTTGTVTDYVTLSSSSGVPVVCVTLGGEFLCVKPATSEYACYGYFTSIQYKLEWTKPGRKGITLVSNGGESISAERNLVYYSSNNVKYTLPTNPFTREGYEFVGWHASSSASVTEALAPGTQVTVSGFPNYYAIWRTKKYPVTTYDVWTDGTNSATTIRKQIYVEHGNTVSFNKDSATTTYSQSTLHPKAGGENYSGFTLDPQNPSYQITHTINSSGTTNFKTNEWTIAKNTTKTPLASMSNATGALWGYYVWNLNAPTATITNPTVDYGTSVVLDDQATPAHDAPNAIFKKVWANESGQYTFYLEDSTELFAQEESGTYRLTLTVSVMKGTTKLTKQTTAYTCKVTINPIKLTIELLEQKTFAYTGEILDYPANTVVDTAAYANLTDEQKDRIKSVFDFEREQGKPYYYSEESLHNDVSKWKYGLSVVLVGLGFESYIGKEEKDGNQVNIYAGTINDDGYAQFRDAGEYYVSVVHLKKSGYTGSSPFNPNYTWSAHADNSNKQIYSLNDINATGVVKATITPLSLNIYASYVEKSFGVINDPVATAVYTDKDSWIISDEFADKANWYLVFDGLVSADYTYATKIAQQLKRDTSAVMPQKAGSYDVYLTLEALIKIMGNDERKFAILNNYGVKLSSADATTATESAINMYWIDKDGTLLSETPYDFTTAITSYLKSRKNFVIVPKEITLTYSGTTQFTYNGEAQGPSQIIMNGMLSQQQSSQLGANYNESLKIYFYGIPLPYPDGWDDYTQEQKDSYIDDNKKIVGTQNKNFASIDNQVITFTETHAGKYGVAIVGTAYKDSEGNYHENTDFVLQNHFTVEWTISRVTISPDAPDSSSTFGDVNYGQMMFTFNNIIEGDTLKLGTVEIYYNNVKDSLTAPQNFRYIDLTTDTEITNGNPTYGFYGLYAGTYKIVLESVTNNVAEGTITSTGFYGAPYGNDYTLTKATYTITIGARQVTSSSWQYTTDGTNYSTTKPEMTYVYNVKQGARITLSNFMAEDFLENDISAVTSTGNGVFYLASEIANTQRITIVRSGTVQEIAEKKATSITFTYLTVNAGTYDVGISKINYTVGNNSYNNFTLPGSSSLTANFKINRKVIGITYVLSCKIDDTTTTQTTLTAENNTVIYNGKAYTVTATFNYSTATGGTANDGKVYFEDYNDGKVYIKFDKLSLTSLVLNGEKQATNVKQSTDDTAEENVFYRATVNQLSEDGNYKIAEDDLYRDWRIARRKFTIEIPDAGSVKVYDGTESLLLVNLKAVKEASEPNITVNISDFSAVISGNNFETNATYSKSKNAFTGINVGFYTLVYDAGTDGIAIDSNWLLIGSANYDEDNCLFAIIPCVLTANFGESSNTYNAQDQKASFYPTMDGKTAEGVFVSTGSANISLTYAISYLRNESYETVTAMLHAGTYKMTVTSATGSNNFVLASATAHEGKWYTEFEGYSDYYTSSETIAGYTATLKIDPKTIAINRAAIDAALPNYTYDGTTKGHTLAEIYGEIKDNSGETIKDKLYSVDQSVYSLKGSAETAKNKGTYKVTITGFNSTNGYLDYTFPESSYEIFWSINARTLTFNYTPYHNSTNETFSYDGKEHGYTFVVGNILTGEDLKLSFEAANLSVTSPINIASSNSTVLAGTEAQTYSIGTFTIADGTNGLAKNYTVPEGGTGKEWEIVQRELTITWKNLSLVYRASEYTPENGGACAELVGLVSGDEVEISYSGVSKATNAGTNTLSVSLSGKDAENYKITGATSKQWTINKKSITKFDWAGNSGFDGFAVVYDGEEHYVTATAQKGAQTANDGKVYDSDSVSFEYSTATGYSTSETLVGEYVTKISKLTGLSQGNYYIPDNAEQSSQEWEITARTLTVTFTYNFGKEIVYANRYSGVVITIEGIVTSDATDGNISFSIGKTGFPADGISDEGTENGKYTIGLRARNVGEYSSTVAIADCARASCYTLVKAPDRIKNESGTFNTVENNSFTAQFKIIPLVAQIIWTLCSHAGYTVPYDGTEHVLSAIVDNAYSVDTVTVTLQNHKGTDVGTYTGKAIALDGADKNNYTLTGCTTAEKQFKISARELGVNYTTGSYVYNGQYQSNPLEISNALTSETVYLKVKFYADSTLIKTVVVSATGKTSYDYTATDFEATVDAGSYRIELDGAVYSNNACTTENGNYSLPSSGRTTAYEIAQATVTLSGVWTYSSGGESAEYTDSTKLIYNASEYTFTTSLDTDSLFKRLNSTTKDEIGLTYSDNVKKNADTYTATVSGLSGTYAGNYTLPTTGVALDFEIHAKKVKLVWENHENLVYNGTNYVVSAKAESGATKDDDLKVYAVDAPVTVATYDKNAGYRAVDDYTTTALTLSNSNYAIAENATLDWSIDPLPVKLSWAFDSVIYNGTARTVTATLSNLVAGDVVTFTYKNNSYTDVDDYTAEVTALGGKDGGNYTLTGGEKVSHDWKITPVTLEITQTNNNLTYNGSKQSVTLNIEGIVTRDRNDTSISYSVTATDQEVTVAYNAITVKATNAKQYTVTISEIKGTAAGNYLLPEKKSFTYTIAPKIITVKWQDNKSFVYGKTAYSVSATVTNLALPTDTVTLTYKTDGENGNSAIHAGEHTTVVSAVDNANYTITGASGLSCKWNISQKPLTEITFYIGGTETNKVTYKGSAFAVTATATSGATKTDDGKVYTGDTVNLTCYRGNSVATVTNAGDYTVTVISDNDDYDVSGVTFSCSVEKRTLTVTLSSIPTNGFVYNGKPQGVTVTITNLVAADNTIDNFRLDYTFTASGTVGNAVRNGTTSTRTFTGKNVGTYEASATFKGDKASNYRLVDSEGEALESIEFTFKIIQADITTEITANVNENTLVYSAQAVTASDLDISFTGLVTGETLQLGDDFSVTYYKDDEEISAPTTVGVYEAEIALTGNSASGNYRLINTTKFEFKIVPYAIQPSMAKYYLGSDKVNLNALTFKENENKTITVVIDDPIYTATSDLELSYIYFGFCNCATEATSSTADGVHADHQWLLDNGNFRTEGPIHAGLYYTVITLSGDGAENFVFEGFDGYDGDYFKKEEEDTFFTYKGKTEKAMTKALPKLDGNVALVNFGVGRSAEGLTFTGTSELPYKGAYYKPQENGLPYISEGSDTSKVKVTVNSTEYTYSAYLTNNIVKNAGDYAIRIFDSELAGHELSGCDLFKEDAAMEYSIELTVTKSKITVTDSSVDTFETSWTKVYDKTLAYTGFTYATGVTFDADVETDGVITGTTVTVSARYDAVTAGERKLSFTLGGADRANYYLVFESDDETTESELSETSEYIYILDGKIDKKPITVTSAPEKVFDGDKNVTFEITGNAVITGDKVQATAELASANVGNHAITKISTDNANYTVTAQSGAKGEITPKALTLTWEDTITSFIYDGDQHGVSVTISGMVKDFEEALNFAINETVTGSISAGTTEYDFTAKNASEYTVTISLIENTNYTLNETDASDEWEITKATLTVILTTDNLADEDNYIYEWDGFTVKYSGRSRGLVAEITDGLVEGDTVTFNITNNTKTDVGDYTAVISTNLRGADAGNYKLASSVSKDWKIVKADIEIDIDDVTATYDNEPHGITVTDTTQHGINCDVSYSGGTTKTDEALDGKNAIVHVALDKDNKPIAVTITVTVDAGGNYNTLEVEKTVTVLPAKIQSIIMDGDDVTYDKQEHSLAVNKITTNFGDEMEVTYTISDGTTTTEGNSAINAGTYTVTATIGATNYDYELLQRTATLKIAKADITSKVTISDDLDVVYKADYYEIAISVENNKTQYGDPITAIVYTGGENNTGKAKNVGTYTVNAVIKAGNNYNDLTTDSATIKISAKSVTLTYPTDNLVYNGNNRTITVSFATGATKDDDGKVYSADTAVTVSLSYLGKKGAADGKTTLRNAGTYDVTATLSSNNYVAKNNKAEIIIEQAEITGAYFVGYTKTYDGKLHYVSVNTTNVARDEANMIKSRNLLASDQATITYKYDVTEDGDFEDEFTGVKNVGTYYVIATINPVGNAVGNYKAWSKTCTVILEKARITSFTMNELTAQYNGKAHKIEISVDKSTQHVNDKYYTLYGDEVTVSYKINDGKTTSEGNSAINAGTYEVTATLTFVSNEAKNNYLDLQPLTATLTVNKVSFKNISLTGGTFTYDGKVHNAVLTVPASGEPSLTLSGTESPYTLTVEFSNGHTDTFEIEFAEDDGKTPKNVGTYYFTATITDSEDDVLKNYDDSDPRTASIIITPAKMADSTGARLVKGENIFYNDFEITYDSLSHFVVLASSSAGSILTTDSTKVVSSMTVYPESESTPAVSNTATVTYTRNSTSFAGAKNAGTYVITAAIANANYETLRVSCTVKINKADIEYYFVGSELTFDMNTHYAGLSAEEKYVGNTAGISTVSLIGNDTATVSYTYSSQNNGEGDFEGAENADTYLITATLSLPDSIKGNYNNWYGDEDNSHTVTLKINPYRTTVNWTGTTAEYVYNGQNRSSSVRATFNLPNGKTETMKITFTGKSGKADGDKEFINSGTYDVVAEPTVSDADNFIFTDKDDPTIDLREKELQIKKADLVRYLSDESVEYSAENYYLTVSRNTGESLTKDYSDEIETLYGDVVKITYTYAKNNVADNHDTYRTEDGELVTLYQGARNVGSYAVTALIDFDGKESNFNQWSPALSATLTITPLTLSITSENNFEKVYDGTTAVKKYTISGMNEDNKNYVDFVATYSSKSAAQNKPITVSIITKEGCENYAYLANNYIIPSSVTGTITKKALTVDTEFTSWRKQYDGTVEHPDNGRPKFVLGSSHGVIADDVVILQAQYDYKDVATAKKVLLTLSGKDSNNYSVASLDFTDVVDLDEEIYLIYPRVTTINWSMDDETVYTGKAKTITASITTAVSADGNGNIPITLTMTKDGNGEDLEEEISGATFKYAGTYVATPNQDKIDENILINYGILLVEKEFVIKKANLQVVWTKATKYVYNGDKQELKAKVGLLGDDKTAYDEEACLVKTFKKGATATDFITAGSYTVTADFATETKDFIETLENNYSLTSNETSATIEKADVTNLKFTGEAKWTYYSGETHFFFVVPATATNGYASVIDDGAMTGITTDFYYQYDQTTKIQITYAGGSTSHESVPGSNGVINAGKHTVRATVASTDNYNSWTSSISVDVEKGTIDNVFMKNYSTKYDGKAHYLYAHNSEDEDPSTPSTVYLPDGTTARITYTIAANESCYDDYEIVIGANQKNYAIDAGLYAVNAVVSGSNYYEFEIKEIYLGIEQAKRSIIWIYDKSETANYVYNAQNQLSTVKAFFLLADDTQLNLAISAELKETFVPAEQIDNALKTAFVLAGKYDFNASVPEDTTNYNQILNNYSLTEQDKKLTMKQFTVSIKWYYLDGHKGTETEYSVDDPCIYDGTEHGVSAIGLGIDGEMEIITDGTFEAENAGKYTALVKEIKDGVDTVKLDGKNYSISFRLNYTLDNNSLEWRIAQRKIYVTFANDNELSKVYDGTTGFDFDEPTISRDKQEDGTVSITFSYANKSGDANTKIKFSYTIENIVEKDQNNVYLPISSIDAIKANVKATRAFIVFSGLIFQDNDDDDNNNHNYVIASDISGKYEDFENLITQRPIDVTLSSLSHVYNGKSFSVEIEKDKKIDSPEKCQTEYGKAVFSLSRNGTDLPGLLEGNYISGSVSIGGKTNAGNYDLTGKDFVITDDEGAENYKITTFKNGKYEIKQREIQIDYDNTLQSLNQKPFKDVTAVVNCEESDYTNDLGTVAELEALLQTDNFMVTVDNKWKQETYTQYTLVTDEDKLSVIASSDNYKINSPILQITFIKLKKDYEDDYVFTVGSLADVLHLDSDSYGLAECRADYGIGIIPTYEQTADISGIGADGAYAVMPSIDNFIGNYDGKNYSVNNMSVIPSNGSYVGFFGEIAEGSLKNLALNDIYVYAVGDYSAAGGAVGKVGEEVVINNLTFNGTLYAKVTKGEVAVGGVFGEIDTATVENILATVKMTVKVSAANNLYAGGFAGKAQGATISEITVFDDATVIIDGAVLERKIGGILASAEECEISEYTYLAHGIFVKDSEGSSLVSVAFGDTADGANGQTYSDFANDTDFAPILNAYAVRTYLLNNKKGTSTDAITVSNFRQVALIVAYPYMHFNVTKEIYVPTKILTHDRGFSGTITYASGGVVKASVPSEINLLAASKDNQNVIIRKEDYNAN